MAHQERTAIDFFSGCGGLSLGLKRAGFRILACCEIRGEARDAYMLNHDGVKIYEDIRLVDGDTLLNNLSLKKGELDLLAACPPCQGFSSIRTRNGQIAFDPRNELIFDVLRLAKSLLPKSILIENVPRLLKDQRLMAFKSALVEEGYVFSEGVLDAQNFGVAQRRRRMILIGCRLGEVGLPERGGERKAVKDVIGGLPSPESPHKRPLHRIRQHLTPKVVDRVRAIQRNRSELPPELELGCHIRCPNGFNDVYGRIAWDDVAPTLTRFSHNPSKGRFLHPSEHRGLTIYESMLLQGFPKRYKLPPNLRIGKLSSLLGEAFPPPMAAAQAIHIRQKLERFETSLGTTDCIGVDQ